MTFDGSIWLDALLERLESHLAARAVYPASQIFAYIGDGADLLDHPPAEQFLSIGVRELGPNQGVVTGGGRVVPQFDAVIVCTQYARVWADRAKQDARLLKDRSRGLLRALRSLTVAMQLWDAAPAPTTPGATVHSPLAEPVRMPGAARFNGRRPVFGWASVESTWELKFRADLEATVG
jgi:hypothetical protein